MKKIETLDDAHEFIDAVVCGDVETRDLYLTDKQVAHANAAQGLALIEEEKNYLHRLLIDDIKGTEEALYRHGDENPTGCTKACECQTWKQDLLHARALLEELEVMGRE